MSNIQIGILLIVAGCIIGFLATYVQLIIFGKRIKKLEDQLNSGNVPKQ